MLLGTFFYLPKLSIEHSIHFGCNNRGLIWYSETSSEASSPSTAAEAALLPLKEPSVYIKIYLGKCCTIPLCAAWYKAGLV